MREIDAIDLSHPIHLEIFELASIKDYLPKVASSVTVNVNRKIPLIVEMGRKRGFASPTRSFYV
jgi:hypothetical protein